MPTKAAIRANGTPRTSMDIEQIFGENTFGLEAMKSRLPASAYKQLVATIEQGAPISMEVADAVALAMKEWALEHGASHFSHWFQPLTGGTAEKHDSFITPNKGGGAIAAFSGKDLIQGESDASSFPSGGLRATFEARGYTTWDPSSPAFLIENENGNYLAIPTAFSSWTGEALDTKIPLLRSTEALGRQAARVLRLFGVTNFSKVVPTIGNEQEYFLIESKNFQRRPDLVITGRTLFGAKPPRGQELHDHYFGTIPDRVLSYMLEVERELYRLGVPIKTRHNEVAPSQYEIAPIYETANIAADHQQLVMMTLRRLAPRFGLACLLHEKPFAGVNGSGKHSNWALATDTGMNLLEPGETPHQNMQFLFFCAAVVRAVHQHQDLLRVSVASAGNDHRLGGNEAPPAILSVFLGDQLEDVFSQLESGPARSLKQGGLLGLGTPVLPEIPRHAADRNRTSPFAFTGNKFEFRSLGSSQSASFSTTVINTIVAESLDVMATMLEERLNGGEDRRALEKAVHSVLAEVVRESKPIIFHGDGYSRAWHEEAARRGLLNLRTALDAIEAFATDDNKALFARYGVFSAREVDSRREVMLDQYFKTINIEAETTARIARTMLFPAAIRYLGQLATTATARADAALAFDGVKEAAAEVGEKVDAFRHAINALVAQNAELGGDDVRSKAYHMRDNVIPAMNAVRETADALEDLVARDLWPLPSYQEILFEK